MAGPSGDVRARRFSEVIHEHQCGRCFNYPLVRLANMRREFLTKPLREQELLDAVHAAVEHDRARRRQAKLVAELQGRLSSLTARERDVLLLVVTGSPNKQIAYQLNLSEMTVKVHHSHVMRKMQAKSLVDLVRMADKLGISAGESQRSVGDV